MCGIIARIGKSKKPNLVIEGLKFLEYRGYDSFGLAYKTNKINLVKDVGTISNKHIDLISKEKSSIEMGHTRWATHGGVSKEFSHPHYDLNKQIYLVMNGVIENIEELNEKYTFNFSNDTKLLSEILGFELTYNSNVKEVINKVTNLCIGDFSFVAIIENTLFCYKRGNPLCIGKNNQEFIVCSDISFVHEKGNYLAVIDDETIVEINKDNICSNKNLNFEKTQDVEKININSNNYYMEKEIYEQAELNVDTQNNLEVIKEISKNLKSNKIVLIGAGSSYYACLYLHYLLLKQNIVSNCIIASEINNYISSINDSTIIVISQSGETADLIRPIEKLKKTNKIVSIVNTQYSTIDRLANYTLYLNSGRELGVAATKSFMSQLLLSHKIVRELGFDYECYNFDLKKCIEENIEIIDKICQDFSNAKSYFFIGKNESYPLALEGALKFRELTYMNAFGIPSGELKHGTLSLIEDNVPVFIANSNNEDVKKSVEEIKSRGGVIIDNNNLNYKLSYNNDLEAVLIFQLIAFKMAIFKGNNPDKPRNLAKSVTVG